ncbi:protein of unknown function [Lachnospiraceae bacterium RM5]|nr:protein of unknown function [Lachnospiraceae bacterium RM5]
MKKTISLLLIILMIFLTSCRMSESRKLEQRKKKERKEIAETIIESINNKDTDQMKKLFCDLYQDNTELEWDINDFFDCIDGNIVSYELNDSEEMEKTLVEDGEIVFDYESISIEKIMTNKKQKYDIYVAMYWIDKEHEEVEGITQISLYYGDEKLYCIAYEHEA